MTSRNLITGSGSVIGTPLNEVISFKREVYRRAMKELALPLGRHTQTWDERVMREANA